MVIAGFYHILLEIFRTFIFFLLEHNQIVQTNKHCFQFFASGLDTKFQCKYAGYTM